jgi:hypothetical protein
MDPSVAPGVSVKVIRQAVAPIIDRRHRPARSTGGGCGGGGVAGCGGGEASTCSLGAAAKRDVLVQAPVAARVRIKAAAVAPRPPGLLHLDIIMQSDESSDWNRSKGPLSGRCKRFATSTSTAIHSRIDEDEGYIQDNQ